MLAYLKLSCIQRPRALKHFHEIINRTILSNIIEIFQPKFFLFDKSRLTLALTCIFQKLPVTLVKLSRKELGVGLDINLF